MTPEVRVLPDLDALGLEGARAIARAVAESSRETCSIALSGGNTPRGTYQRLAGHFRQLLPWERVHFFWGDERYVPHDSPKSNYRMAREAMLDALPLSAANVHPIPTDRESPEEGARRYEEELLKHFGEVIPRFDINLLGIGDDGHTASLFPGSPALAERSRLAVVTHAPVEPATRISLTFPVLDAARLTIVLASGESKREIVRTILDDPQRARELYPAALLEPEGELLWLVDRAAYG